MITTKKNSLSYHPIFPQGKIVRTHGGYNSNTFVLIWWKFVIFVELPCKKKRQTKQTITFIK